MEVIPWRGEGCRGDGGWDMFDHFGGSEDAEGDADGVSILDHTGAQQEPQQSGHSGHSQMSMPITLYNKAKGRERQVKRTTIIAYDRVHFEGTNCLPSWGAPRTAYDRVHLAGTFLHTKSH
jgi:hypothetical protein